MSLIGNSYSSKDGALDLALLVWIFAIPLHPNFSTVTLGIILIVSLYRLFSDWKFPSVQMHWFLPALFLYFVLSNLLSIPNWYGIEKKLSLLLVPLVFLLNPYFWRQEIRKKTYISFILGTVTAVVVCLIRAISRSLSLVEGQWHFNPKVIQGTTFDFLTSSVMGGNYFFGSEFSWFAHTTYFGMYIVFAQALIFELSKSMDNRREKYLLGLGHFLLLIPLFLLSSRAAIITSLILTIYIFFKSAESSRARAIGMLVIVGGSFFLLISNPRFKDLTDFVSGTNTRLDPNAKYGLPLRLLSWDASLEIIKNNWLIGVGEENKEDALFEVYERKGYNFPAQEKFNSHNQYFDLLLGGGIVALGLFLIGLGQLLVRSWKNQSFPLAVFLLLILFNSLFENWLGLYAGVSFFTIFLTLLGTKSRALETLDASNAPVGVI